MRPSTAFLSLIAVTLAMHSLAQADEIYRWVGEDGVVHFSDTRPDEADEVTTVTVDITQSPDYDPAEDPYSTLNQASRIHENWLEIENMRQQRAEERIAEQQTVNSTTQQFYRGYGYQPSYGYPAPLPPVAGNPSRLGRQQIHALNQLDLLGPRPYSINSFAHQSRVQRSRALPLVPPPKPPPRPTPYPRPR